MKNNLPLAVAACLLLSACATKHAQVKEPALPPATLAPAAAEAVPAKPQEPVVTATQPEVIQPAIPPDDTPALKSQNTVTPQDPVAVARARQTLQTPPADVATFEGEAAISPDGRRFSPFAYEPVTPNQGKAPWKDEALKYGLYYSFIKAGTAYIKTRGLTTVNGRQAYLIQTTAFSAPVIDAVFKVRDINFSWIDAEDFSSLGYSQSVREGSYKRDEWLTFDYANHRLYGEVQKKEEPRVLSGALDMKVLDMLSSLYFVRTQTLNAGQDVVFDIVNREKQYPLLVKVLGKETVKTAAGKFDCIVVEPQFRGEGIFVSKGKSLKVWLTDDEYKMPVKMKVEVFIGSVSAELLEYKRN